MDSVDFSPDMKYIIAGGGYENDVRLWDLQT
jgi:WD40 repeat protein